MNENLTPIILKEHLNNLVEAIFALFPSRNYISQFLQLLPQDYGVLFEAYPGVLQDREARKYFTQLLGLSFGPLVTLSGDHCFGERFESFIPAFLEYFSDETVLQKWNDFLVDVREQPLPNPLREWVNIKVLMAVHEPFHGQLAKKLLDLLVVQEKEIVSSNRNISGDVLAVARDNLADGDVIEPSSSHPLEEMEDGFTGSPLITTGLNKPVDSAEYRSEPDLRDILLTPEILSNKLAVPDRSVETLVELLRDNLNLISLQEYTFQDGNRVKYWRLKKHFYAKWIEASLLSFSESVE
ncbi:MAG: hypothetical protein ACTSRU_16760 [Candidatus Hodarchaeales archaeon]